MASGNRHILLPYQRRWVNDSAALKIWVASRQIGKSFAISFEAVTEALRARCDNLILSSSERQSKEVMFKVAQHLRVLKALAPAEITKLERDSRTEVMLTSGSRIISLPASPNTVRGFSGNVYLDEFAFHADSREIWRAMYPTVTRGYRVRVTSTPNGRQNMFYELYAHGDGFSRHSTSIYDAKAGGLEVDVDELRKGVRDPETWAQEYECQFVDEATAFLTHELISSAEHEDASVDFVPEGGSVGGTESPMRIEESPMRFLGVDIGRKHDLTVFWLIEKTGDVFWTRMVRELRGAPFAAQRAALYDLMQCSAIRRACIDATGLGAQLSEEAAERFGSRVEPVTFTAPVKEDLAITTRRAFEDRRVRIPINNAIRQDLHSVKRVVTPSGNTRLLGEPLMAAPLSVADYPGLDPRKSGAIPAAGYGTMDGVGCHAVESGAAVVLASALTSTAESATVVNASRLPSAPFTLQAAAEHLRVTAVNDDLLSITRGCDGTRPSAHPAGRSLFEVRASYVYLVADHPVKAVGHVYIDSQRQLEGFYSAYTGQSGDELTGYEGKAVIVMSAAPYVGRQFNLTSLTASGRATGSALPMASVAWSSASIVDGCSSTHALAGGVSGRPVAWAAFDKPYGPVIAQLYEADLENASLDEVRVTLVVRQGGAYLASREFSLAGGTQKTLTLWRGPGQEDDELAIIPAGGQIKVYALRKTVSVDESLEPLSAVKLTMPPRGPGRTALLMARGRTRLRADYPDGPTGALKSQSHRVTVTEASGTGGARVRVAAGQYGFREFVINAGETETVIVEHEGGTWSTPTVTVALMGRLRVEGVQKTVEYYPTGAGVSREPLASCSARVVVGDEVRADVELAVDIDGTYGGVGTLIERPDHVMRHFLTSRMGFGVSDLDTDSFDDAGTLYASAITGGYRMALLTDEALAPSELLRRMARECRSVIRYSGGKWRLDCLPDSAPSAIKTITSGELAGQDAMFVFDRVPIVELANSITARYGPGAGGDMPWLGVATATDSASVAKYGDYAGMYDFLCLRHKETAESVLGHMLKQRSTPLMTVRFTVFYEHFDLEVGDTIEIDNDLYGGEKFFVERIRRVDQFRAEVEALQWWG